MSLLYVLTLGWGWTLACSRWESRYIARTVTDHEVVGVWVMTENSVADLRRVGYSDVAAHTHRISVFAEHQCRYQTLVDAVGPNGPVRDQMDVPCEWMLKRIAKHQALSITTRTDPPRHVHYYFSAAPDGRLVLFRSVADPDLQAFVEYERVLPR